MITLLRKIRQRLLKENNFIRYLLYAIGEIVLVVLGILIALQINNWNEAKKEQVIVNASLSSLKLNLKEDIENLKKQIKYNEAVLEDVDFAFRIISFPEYKNVPLSIYVDSIFDIATERTFLPSKTAFKSMESGSHFQWINNQALTESIYKYYVILDGISALTKENNQFVKTHMEGFTYNEMEFGALIPNVNPYSAKQKMDVNNTKKIRESPIFENALIGRKFRANGEIDRSEEAIINANELIHLIDQYLNNNK